MVVIALGAAQAKHVLSTSMLHQYKLEQGGSMQCIVFFSLVKLDINLKKITHSKSFLLNGLGAEEKFRFFL